MCLLVAVVDLLHSANARASGAVVEYSMQVILNLANFGYNGNLEATQTQLAAEGACAGTAVTAPLQ